MATAIALIIYFWRDWVRIIRGLVTSIVRREVVDADQRLAWLLVLATIPVGLVGLLAEHWLRTTLGKPDAGGDLPDRQRADPARRPSSCAAATRGLHDRVRGRARVRARVRRPAGPGPGRAGGARSARCRSPRWRPGISRSGITMVGGLLRGLSREDAARFSFLLATPVILAAGALKLPDLTGRLGDGIRGQVLFGSVLSGIGAYLSVRFLTRYFAEPLAAPVRLLLPGRRAGQPASVRSALSVRDRADRAGSVVSREPEVTVTLPVRRGAPVLCGSAAALPDHGLRDRRRAGHRDALMWMLTGAVDVAQLKTVERHRLDRARLPVPDLRGDRAAPGHQAALAVRADRRGGGCRRHDPADVVRRRALRAHAPRRASQRESARGASLEPTPPTSAAVRGDQVVAGPGDARADRADRAAAHVGRLGVGEPDQLGQHERLAPVGIEGARAAAGRSPTRPGQAPDRTARPAPRASPHRASGPRRRRRGGRSRAARCAPTSGRRSGAATGTPARRSLGSGRRRRRASRGGRTAARRRPGCRGRTLAAAPASPRRARSAAAVSSSSSSGSSDVHLVLRRKSREPIGHFSRLFWYEV